MEVCEVYYVYRMLNNSEVTTDADNVIIIALNVKYWTHFYSSENNMLI